MSGTGKRIKTRWRLEDLVAYECALAKDEGEEWRVLKAQDTETELDPEVVQSGDRRAIAKSWLSVRLDKAPEIKLASDSVSQSIGTAGQLMGVGGLLTGIGSATAALAYTGQEPINVSAFFCVFVLLQAILAAVLLVVFALPRSWREAMAFGPLFRFGRWIFDAILGKMQLLASRFLSGQQRQDAAEWAGVARRSFALHGTTAKWLAFVKLQAAALCFNFGVLLALLVSVAFSDRAFGWQTTLDASSASVHELVQGVAIPWAWFLDEGVGYPSQDQVEGSRIVLKEGIQGLATADLAVWWQFLAMGILFYGILPRLLFYGLGKWQVAVALARFDFRNAASERLMERLRPDPSRFDIEAVQQGADSGGPGGSSAEREFLVRQKVVCLCSKELGESFDLNSLSFSLAKRWNLATEAITVKTYQDGAMEEELSEVPEDVQVAVVFESWMPPIREIERQIANLRAELDEKVLIKIVLLGIPASEDEAVSLKPEKQYAQAWHSFVRRMGDPYLILDNPAI